MEIDIQAKAEIRVLIDNAKSLIELVDGYVESLDIAQSNEGMNIRNASLMASNQLRDAITSLDKIHFAA
jgi:hypothetical protein